MTFSLGARLEEEEEVDLEVYQLKPTKLLSVSEEYVMMWGRRDRFWSQVNLGLTPSSVIN